MDDAGSVLAVLFAVVLCACQSDPTEEETGQAEMAPGPDCTDEPWPAATPYNVLLAHLVAGTLDQQMLRDLSAIVDWLDDVAGPWSHQILGPIVSDDGLVFDEQELALVRERASVPNVVVDDDDQLWLFFVDGDLDQAMAYAERGEPMLTGAIGFCGLAALVSADGQGWEEVELRIDGELPECLVDPDIHRLVDGRWRLTWLALSSAEACADTPDPALMPVPHRLQSAVSWDLRNWEHEGDSWTAQRQATDPGVWCDGVGSCWAWFQEGLASDDEGLSWQSSAEVQVDFEPQAPDVLRMSDGYVMYMDSSGSEEQGQAAWSDDGLLFELRRNLRIDPVVATAVELDGQVLGFSQQKMQHRVTASSSVPWSDMGNTGLAVLIMLVATSMTNIGAVLQKKAVDGLPPFDSAPLLDSVRAVLRTPLWLVGWLLATSAIVLNMVALGLADISVIQPLNGFGLVVLAVFSRFYLGERLAGPALGGVVLVIAGVAAVGFMLPPSQVFASAQEILACYTHGGAVAALGGFVLVAGGAWWLARRWAGMAGILFAFAAATCSVLGLSFSKGFFGMLTVVGPGATLGAWPSYLLLALLLCFSALALMLQQLSFQKGRAVVVTPVFASASVALPLAVGWFVFHERLPAAALAGPVLIALGVVLLGLRDDGTSLKGAA